MEIMTPFDDQLLMVDFLLPRVLIKKFDTQ